MAFHPSATPKQAPLQPQGLSDPLSRPLRDPLHTQPSQDHLQSQQVPRDPLAGAPPLQPCSQLQPATASQDNRLLNELLPKQADPLAATRGGTHATTRDLHTQSEQDMGLLQQLLLQPDTAPSALGRVRLGSSSVGPVHQPHTSDITPYQPNQAPLDQLLLQQQIVEQQRGYHELELARLHDQQMQRQFHTQEWSQRAQSTNVGGIADWENSFIAQKDDQALAQIMSLGMDIVGPPLAPASVSVSSARKIKFGRPQSARSHQAVRHKRSASGTAGLQRQRLQPSTHVCVEIRRKEDLLRLSKAVSLADDTLSRDMDISKVRLPRGLKLLREGPLKGCKSLCAALAATEPWVTLTFERPPESKPRHAIPGRMCVEVLQADELILLAKAVSASNHMLQTDIEIGGIRLPQGSRMLLDGQLKGSAFIHDSISRLKPRVVLTFEKPGKGGLQVTPGYHSLPWACPLCNNWYPVQVPGDLMASDLLQHLLPEGSFILEQDYGDLWVKSEIDKQPEIYATGVDGLGPLDAPLKDDQGHTLQLYAAPRDLFPCTVCASELAAGASMYGCTECFFFMCMACVTRFAKSQRSVDSETLVPLPSTEELRSNAAEAVEQQQLRLLVRFAGDHFDLGPVLHFGRIRRLVTDAPEVARYCQRDMAGILLPLADPYDYYARAAILHSLVPICKTEEHRDQVLHEAYESLLQALHGSRSLNGRSYIGQQQYKHMQAQNPLSGVVDRRTCEDRAAADPRIWYLLGLVLCDLGALADARLCYRKVLERLPMSNFRHIVYFNLAILQVGMPGEASRRAALTELWEFRRCCTSLQGIPPIEATISAHARHCCRCDLCGATL